MSEGEIITAIAGWTIAACTCFMIYDLVRSAV